MNLFIVWSIASVLAAAIGGAVLGAFLALFPSIVRSQRVSPSKAPVAGLFLVYSGAVFYAGQLVDASVTADPGIARLVSRFLLWLLFSASVTGGAYLTLRMRGES